MTVFSTELHGQVLFYSTQDELEAKILAIKEDQQREYDRLFSNDHKVATDKVEVPVDVGELVPSQSVASDDEVPTDVVGTEDESSKEPALLDTTDDVLVATEDSVVPTDEVVEPVVTTKRKRK
jgi:hypothetical protein